MNYIIKIPLIELDRTKKQESQSNKQAYIDDRQNNSSEAKSDKKSNKLHYQVSWTSPTHTSSKMKNNQSKTKYSSLPQSDSYTIEVQSPSIISNHPTSNNNANPTSILRKRTINFKSSSKNKSDNNSNSSNANSTIKTKKELKLAYSEFYLSLILLQKYQELNFTGFRKILKKHDKITDTEFGQIFRSEKVEKMAFFTNSQVAALILQVETVMTDLEGDRSKAMKRLRVPPLDKSKDYPIWLVYRVGMFTGILAVSLVLLIYKAFIIVKLDGTQSTQDISNITTTENQSIQSLSHVYNLLRFLWLLRPLFMIWLFMIFLGINIYAFKCAGVNHVLIFEIDPRNHLGHLHFLEIGSFLGIIWSIILHVQCNLQLAELHNVSQPKDFLGNLTAEPNAIFSTINYFNSNTTSEAFFVDFIQNHCYPLIKITYICLFLWMINPINILYKSSRYWLLKTTLRCLLFGYYEVKFADFWLADQFNSLVPILVDSSKIICEFVDPKFMVDVNETEKLGRTTFLDDFGEEKNLGIDSLLLGIWKIYIMSIFVAARWN